MLRIRYGEVSEWVNVWRFTGLKRQAVLDAVRQSQDRFQRRGVRVVEGARLESVYTETYRGFESLPLRHIKGLKY